ncbi:MAG: hypothetical protein ACTSVI_16595 [Promethearchaeota archaeon]
MNIGKIFKKIAQHEKKLNNIRTALASEIDALIRTKNEGIRKFRELAKKVEDLTRSKGDSSSVDKSQIDAGDIESHNKWAELFESDVKKLADFSDAIKTLSYQVETLVSKLIAFGEGFENVGKAREKLTRADKTLFEKKDKLMSPEKIGVMENNKEEAIRAFEMAKTDIKRRKDEYLKEAKIFNEKLNDTAEKMKA